MITLIYAKSLNGVIGCNGTIPWHVPEDMAYFKAATAGKVVVMGSKTWHSLPERYRPLPGRENVVLSCNTKLSCVGATVMNSVTDVLDRYTVDDNKDVFIIGGKKIYDAFMPHATHIFETTIGLRVDGDTAAPEIDSLLWQNYYTEALQINGAVSCVVRKYVRVSQLPLRRLYNELANVS
jgi:dihydrofolate reductase